MDDEVEEQCGECQRQDFRVQHVENVRDDWKTLNVDVDVYRELYSGELQCLCDLYNVMLSTIVPDIAASERPYIEPAGKLKAVMTSHARNTIR